jgi:hypothetical protein
MTSKYDPLRDWLNLVATSNVFMTFDEVSRLVGGLPASAEKYDAWWNNEDGDTRHVQCRSWLEAGFHAHVDRIARKVRFHRRD